MTIPRALKNGNNQRIYNKVHYCYFCSKDDQKIGRHLTTDHKTEAEIIDILALGLTSKEGKKKRRQLLDDIRRRGDFQHNMKVLRTGGELVVWRRPAECDVVRVEDYKPCPYCTVFVTVKELWRHARTCDKNHNQEHGTNIVRKAELLLFPNKYAEGASSELKTLVLCNMIKDDITQIVSSDELIMTLGSFLLSSHGFRKCNLISQRMRIMARLLKVLRQNTSKENGSMMEYIQPQYFDEIVNATKILGEYQMSTTEGEAISMFKTPALPLKIGYTFDKCVQIFKGISIKKGNQEMVKNAENVSKLYDLEWGIKISSVSLRTLSLNKFNKVKCLPLTKDLLIIRKHLLQQIPILTAELDAKPVLQTWRCLSEMLGVRLTMFNCRRISEVFGMLISHFNDRQKWKSQELDEVKTSLSPLEQQLMKRYYLIT